MTMDFLIHHMLTTSAQRLPGKEALVHGSQRLTYSEVDTAVNALAHGLSSAGVRRGERVGILFGPSIAQVLSIFAVSKANAVFVPINHSLFPEQVAHIMRDSGMRALITTKSHLSDLAGILSSIPSLTFVVVSGEGDSPAVELPVLSFEDLTSRAMPCMRDQIIEKDLAA